MEILQWQQLIGLYPLSQQSQGCKILINKVSTRNVLLHEFNWPTVHLGFPPFALEPSAVPMQWPRSNDRSSMTRRAMHAFVLLKELGNSPLH